MLSSKKDASTINVKAANPKPIPMKIHVFFLAVSAQKAARFMHGEFDEKGTYAHLEFH